MDMNEDYSKLLQMFNIIKSIDFVSSCQSKEEILQQELNDFNINHQIPDNEYFKLHNPKLIGYTALHYALEETKYDIFEILLKLGADFTIKNNNGDTVLHQAVQFILKNLNNYWEKIDESMICGYEWNISSANSFVNLILSSHNLFNNSTNPINNSGISHFHIACLMNNVNAVQLFLENGVSVNHAVNADSCIVPGYTALHFAVRHFSIETVEILIKTGANSSIKDALKISPLQLLIKRNMEIVNHIDSGFKNQFEVNKRMIKIFIENSISKSCNYVVDDTTGLSDFHAACTLNVDVVEKLIKFVTDLNHSVNKDSPLCAGYTALHFAAHFDIKIVHFLVNKGGNIQLKNCQGLTPLDIMIDKYDACDISFVIHSQPQWKNITFSTKSNWKNILLSQTKLVDLIAFMGTVKEFESFLSKVADINMQIPSHSTLWPGYTPLHLAVAFCNSNKFSGIYQDFNNIYDKLDDNGFEKLKVCLRFGADMTAKDAYGSTPLHLAFNKNRMDIVSMFMAMQIKIENPVDLNGLSHFHIACATPDPNCAYIELLTNNTDTKTPLKSRLILICRDNYPKHPPKITCVNAGSTPLHIAMNAGNIEVIEELLKSGFDINSKDIYGFTPLHHLLTLPKNDRLHDYVKELFVSSELKNCVSNNGLSHLHIACYLRNIEAVEKLLDSGADVNETIQLFQPTDANNFPEIELLYQHQRFIDNIAKYYRHINSLVFLNRYVNYTPLQFALENSSSSHPCQGLDYNLISTLLYKGANIFAKKSNGTVILYEVLSGKDVHLRWLFIKLLKRKSEWLESLRIECGITLLHLACATIDFYAVKRLLENGFDVNARCHLDSPVWPGCTPLHVRLLSINQETIFDKQNSETYDKVCRILKLLLHYGADVLIPNSYYKTPFHLSIQEFNYRPFNAKELHFTKIMLKYHKNYDSNPTDERGISHFHIACVCNDITTVRSFLEHDVDVNQSINHCFNDYDGCTPLHIAAIHRFDSLTHLLLQYKADINAKNRLMETPLHLAFTVCKESDSLLIDDEYIDILLSAGAKSNEVNIYGLTPLEKFLVGIERGDSCSYLVYENILKVIIKHGVCVNAFYPKIDEGFIGLTLCDKNNYPDGLRNPLFQAVINKSDSYVANFSGRSIIHNIVSTRGLPQLVYQQILSTLSTEEYTKVFGKLLELGFDMDCQDNKGFTPLHAAIRFKNKSAIESLLMFGADVNITNASGKVAYFYNIDWNRGNEEVISWPIHEAFVRHFDKLLMFNLDLHIQNKEIMNFMIESPRNEDEKLTTQLIDESNELKKLKIKPYSITLHDFLNENFVHTIFPFFEELQRKTVSNYFQKNREYLRKNFPESIGILTLQYRKAFVRGELVQSAIVLLNNLAGFELPFICYETILKFLKNSELKVFVAAGDLQSTECICKN